MSSPRVAIAGATGNLGPAILSNLVSTGFPVTVLTRQGSNSSSKIESHSNQTIKEVDYSSLESLTSALQGVDVLVSTLGGASIPAQKLMVDAAISAGVKRFIPSEFGADTTNPKSRALPVYGGKTAIQDYLAEKAKENSNFTYTLVLNGGFFDWGCKNGFIVNIAQRSANFYDGGDRPMSVSTLDTIGKGVVGVVKNLDATKNRAVYIQDACVTTSQLVNVAKKLDKEGKEWKIENKDTATIEKEGYEELKKDSPNFGKAMTGFVARAMYGEGYGGDFSDKLDNDLLGIKGYNEKQVEELVGSCL